MLLHLRERWLTREKDRRLRLLDDATLSRVACRTRDGSAPEIAALTVLRDADVPPQMLCGTSPKLEMWLLCPEQAAARCGGDGVAMVGGAHP